MSDKSFENSLRDRLDNYRSEVDHTDLWGKVEADLYPQKKRRVAFWWWAGSGLVLLMFVAVFLRKGLTSGASNVATDRISAPILSEETVPSGSSAETTITESTATIGASVDGNTALSLNTEATKMIRGFEQGILNFDYNAIATAATIPKIELFSSSALEGVPTEPSRLAAVNPSTKLEKVISDLLPRLAISALPNPIRVPSVVQKRARRVRQVRNRREINPVEDARWSISPHLYMGVSNTTVSESAEGTPAYPNSDLGAIGAGLSLGYRLHPRLSVLAGLDYRQLLTRFSGNELLNRVEDTATVVIERIIYADGQVIERMGTGIRTTSTYRKTRLTHRLHTFNIPILLQYESKSFRNGFNWYLQGGVVMNISHRMEGQSINENGNLYDLASSNEFRTRIGWGLQVGAGFSRPINKSMSWQVGAEYRHHLNPSTTDLATSRVQFNPIGIKAGLSWRF